ncbi:MAG: carbohydrate binding domain-containing protein, partial [Planctomycetales bacterium]|nr:carbohydrate binding domain-containing protein [Planctomycetales bacterium]
MIPRLHLRGLNLLALALSYCLGAVSGAQERDEVVIKVHVDQPTVPISPVLYGLFFEDINYAADGGLYAELVQNRSFEYYGVEGWGDNGLRLHPLSAWSKVERNGGAIELEVTDAEPLNENNTKYLKASIRADGVVGVSNSGFGGIVLNKGARYDFSVYARRSEDAEEPLVVALVSPDGAALATGKIVGLGDRWQKHELTLTAAADASDARLELTTTGRGELSLDMVSLFPQDTFKGRKNGLRKDLAQALAELKPGFLRFPGGCIAHGHGLDNAYRWKDTVGDVASRKPNWNLWGYHQTYGLGYFEYMQLCEGMG